MLPWHRLDGEPFRGISVPSQHAHPSEYRSLASVVRRRDRVLQATPNALTKSTVAMLGMLSTGVGRKPLRTTIVAAMDMKTDRKVYTHRHDRRHGAQQAVPRQHPLADAGRAVLELLRRRAHAAVRGVRHGRRRPSAPRSDERKRDVRRSRSFAARFAAIGNRRAAAGLSSQSGRHVGRLVARCRARPANRSPSWPPRPVASRSSSSWTCWPSTTRPSAGRPWSRTIGPSSGNSCSPTTRRCPASTTRGRTPATWPSRTAACKCCSRCCSIRS